MPRNMEEILGLGPFDKKRQVPGTSVPKGREYVYVGCEADDDIEALFRRVVGHVRPPIAKSGGVINEGCKIVLPTGECYFALSYKGDIDGWRQQIEQGAEALGLALAKLDRDRLLLSNGREVLISECQIEFS